MSVEALLQDDIFNNDHLSPVDHFGECSQFYIRGQFKNCLESLFKYNLIETDKGQELFINACDGTPQFESLGVSLQPFVDKCFGKQHWDEYMSKHGVNDFTKYLRNCYKWIQWKGKLEDHIIIETFKQSIEGILTKSLTEDKEVEAVFELFKFYLVQVKVGLLHEHKSVKLYEKLCDKYPKLPILLQQESILGPTYENRLKDLLTVHKKKKHPISVVEPEQISEPIEANNDNLDTTKPKATHIILQQYKQLIQHYFKLLYRSRYRNTITIGIIFSFILLYKCGKWTQRKGPVAIKWVSQWLHALDQY